MLRNIKLIGRDAHLALDIAISLEKFLSGTGGYGSRDDAKMRAAELLQLLRNGLTSN